MDYRLGHGIRPDLGITTRGHLLPMSREIRDGGPRDDPRDLGHSAGSPWDASLQLPVRRAAGLHIHTMFWGESSHTSHTVTCYGLLCIMDCICYFVVYILFELIWLFGLGLFIY